MRMSGRHLFGFDWLTQGQHVLVVVQAKRAVIRCVGFEGVGLLDGLGEFSGGARHFGDVGAGGLVQGSNVHSGHLLSHGAGFAGLRLKPSRLPIFKSKKAQFRNFITPLAYRTLGNIQNSR